jgi:hypothetical protein
MTGQPACLAGRQGGEGTMSLSLFFASFLAVRLSLIPENFIGIILGLVIWAGFLIPGSYLLVVADPHYKNRQNNYKNSCCYGPFGFYGCFFPLFPVNAPKISS